MKEGKGGGVASGYGEKTIFFLLRTKYCEILGSVNEHSNMKLGYINNSKLQLRRYSW